MIKSMLRKWDYSGVDEVCYSDKKCESYKKASEFLDGKCQDWGCGTGYARHFFSDYSGIDCSPSSFVSDKDIVDLVSYTSDVDNILMRQVLELNTEWVNILENVKKSFKKKFCLVIFSPFADETHVGEIEQMTSASGVKRENVYVSVIYFNKQDILNFFPKSEYKISEETIKTEQGYGSEWILYVERL